jgi:predicted nuclease with RNAse H fold
MQTLGIDLAAGAPDTAVCAISWGKKAARVDRVLTGREDRTAMEDPGLVSAMAGADRIGVDVPLGWPVAFVKAIARHEQGKRWRGEDRDAMRFRETDRHVRANVPPILPLSVSTEKLGVTALRGAALIDQLSRRGVAVDRSGVDGPVAEVYPAAALCRWIGRRCSYKGRAPKDPRDELLAQLLAGVGGAMEMGDDARAACVASDHAFDAFVSSLVARAVARGKTARPPKKQRELARQEGWIHVPEEGSLGALS